MQRHIRLEALLNTPLPLFVYLRAVSADGAATSTASSFRNATPRASTTCPIDLIPSLVAVHPALKVHFHTACAALVAMLPFP